MKKMTALRKGILAVVTAAVLVSGIGVYEVQNVRQSMEISTHVDPELVSSIEDEETPLAAAPKTKTTTKTTKSTKTSKKTETLKKASAKTYTKNLPTTTKKTLKTVKKDSNTTVKTDTTVQTYKTEAYTKKSKKKVVTTKAVTTTKVTTTVKVVTTASNKPTAAPQTLDVTKVAPKIDKKVLDAYQTLGFKLVLNPKVTYAGFFSAKDKSITLREQNSTVYHELGHFLGFIAGNYDTSAKFKNIYNKEKSRYTGYNKAYVLQSSSEYFAESVRDYTLDPNGLKKSRPQTYAAVQEALGKVTPAQLSKLRLILSVL